MDISAVELTERLKNKEQLTIIDVRDKLEFATFNLGGLHIPLGRLSIEAEELDMEKDEELIVICAHGIRSKTAVDVLKQSGFSNVRNLKGGILAYRKLNS
ncbi:rhodanese-like domain-containing protein [Solitalea canadensis]|uniref:Rhodanese-related sulfurtransferase n=1 Tax=Solitalea canadensis (strain ATCC 29591 / DSM 3403 / JCM 21819 / LMG 8368 / NBRC 15130 / NCIMB 12057 / USAM 9D) TaxID=929556 RepID=H8KVW0_SOLCM|nr:rhodanese-like domain-containing protein [Solitalea canadensis]AFD06863.1 Rhodanese-related sulfurtransferase [Solitalea canadensis DSM 3403]